MEKHKYNNQIDSSFWYDKYGNVDYDLNSGEVYYFDYSVSEDINLNLSNKDYGSDTESHESYTTPTIEKKVFFR